MGTRRWWQCCGHNHGGIRRMKRRPTLHRPHLKHNTHSQPCHTDSRRRVRMHHVDLAQVARYRTRPVVVAHTGASGAIALASAVALLPVTCALTRNTTLETLLQVGYSTQHSHTATHSHTQPHTQPHTRTHTHAHTHTHTYECTFCSIALIMCA